jgi:hypothetical protein
MAFIYDPNMGDAGGMRWVDDALASSPLAPSSFTTNTAAGYGGSAFAPLPSFSDPTAAVPTWQAQTAGTYQYTDPYTQKAYSLPVIPSGMSPQDVAKLIGSAEAGQSFYQDGNILKAQWGSPGLDANPLTGGYSSHAVDAQYGSPINYFDASGNPSWTGQWDAPDAIDKWGPRIALAIIAAAAGGAASAAAGGGAGGAAGGGGAGSGSVGGAGGFIGEGAASGIGAWDAALANAPSWSAGTGAMGGAASGSGGGGGGFTFNPAADSQLANEALGAEALSGYTGAPIPSVTVNGAPGGGSWWDSLTNAFTPSPGSAGSSALSSLTGGGSGGTNWLGLASTALGGLSGAQGQQGSTSSTRTMDPRLDQPVYGAGGLVPRTQQMLSDQMPWAQRYGAQAMGIGSDLLNSQIPTGPENPYLSGIADDMQRRTMDLLGENNRAIQGNAVGVGGLGGSRQGVAQGMAAGRAADSLQGQLAGLYGNAYQGDMQRQLQRIGLGSGLLSQGQSLWSQPLKDASGIYGNFSGFGNTTQNTDSGGGWQGLLGGALSGASFGRQMGWW